MSLREHLSPDLPPFWLLYHMVAAWALARWLPVVRFEAGVAAWGITLAGVALAGWAVVHFPRHRTPVEPRRTPQALIVGGPYRLNRNPIYTGLVLILLGFALGQGALSALLVVPILPVVIDRRFVRDEEAALIAAFGDEARAWIARTRRW